MILGSIAKAQNPSFPTQPQNDVAEALDTHSLKKYRTRCHQWRGSQTGNLPEISVVGFTGEDPGIYVKRVDGNGTFTSLQSIYPACATSGAPRINDIDVIIGNGGQTILAIYQALGSIDYSRFTWNGNSNSYISQGCGHIAPGSSTDGPFGNPRLDIDQATNSVLITFKSYNNGNPKPYYYSTTINHPGTGSKTILNSNILPTNYDFIKGPVAVCIQEKIGSNPVAHFSMTYKPSSISQELLAHISTPYQTSTGNLSSNFIHDEILMKMPEGQNLQWSSIDNWWDNSGFISPTVGIDMNDNDYWTIAVIHNIPNQGVEVVKAFTGRRNTKGYVMHDVAASVNSCQNSTVDVAYASDVINITWESDDCEGSILQGEDVLTWTMNRYGRSPGIRFYRVNNNKYTNAIHPSTAGGDQLAMNAWLSRTNDSVYIKFPQNFMNWKTLSNNLYESTKEDIKISIRYGKKGEIIIENSASHPSLNIISTVGEIIDPNLQRRGQNLTLESDQIPRGVYYVITKNDATRFLAQ